MLGRRIFVLKCRSQKSHKTVHSPGQVNRALGQLLRSGGSPNRFAYEYVLGATIGPGLMAVAPDWFHASHSLSL